MWGQGPYQQDQYGQPPLQGQAGGYSQAGSVAGVPGAAGAGPYTSVGPGYSQQAQQQMYGQQAGYGHEGMQQAPYSQAYPSGQEAFGAEQYQLQLGMSPYEAWSQQGMAQPGGGYQLAGGKPPGMQLLGHQMPRQPGGAGAGAAGMGQQPGGSTIHHQMGGAPSRPGVMAWPAGGGGVLLARPAGAQPMVYAGAGAPRGGFGPALQTAAPGYARGGGGGGGGMMRGGARGGGGGGRWGGGGGGGGRGGGGGGRRGRGRGGGESRDFAGSSAQVAAVLGQIQSLPPHEPVSSLPLEVITCGWPRPAGAALRCRCRWAVLAALAAPSPAALSSPARRADAPSRALPPLPPSPSPLQRWTAATWRSCSRTCPVTGPPAAQCSYSSSSATRVRARVGGRPGAGGAGARRRGGALRCGRGGRGCCWGALLSRQGVPAGALCG
jgi:hypothetical protein